MNVKEGRTTYVHTINVLQKSIMIRVSIDNKLKNYQRTLTICFRRYMNFSSHFQSSTYPWAISVVFGLAALLAAVAALPLSETLNVDLPDTIKDLEDKQKVISR